MPHLRSHSATFGTPRMTQLRCRDSGCGTALTGASSAAIADSMVCQPGTPNERPGTVEDSRLDHRLR